MTVYTDLAGAAYRVQGADTAQRSPTTACSIMKIRSFLDAIKEGKPAPVPSSQILYNQAIIDGINKSAAAGHEINVEIPEI